ncbi:hypothetical protein ACFL03_10315 [Thermodesulfobacteriota bacterium]
MKIDPKRAAVSENFSQALPLWGSPEVWQEANQTMNHLIHLYGPALERAKGFAHGILDQLMPIFSRLDDLCAVTCPWCPDPCCLVAKVWVDFKDLLFLHLTDQTIPPVQLTQNLDKRCYYIGPRGCTLPRVMRPWICTRYLCPSQLAGLRKKPGSAHEFFDQAFQAVNVRRNKMETEFIRIVS